MISKILVSLGIATICSLIPSLFKTVGVEECCFASRRTTLAVWIGTFLFVFGLFLR